MWGFFDDLHENVHFSCRYDIGSILIYIGSYFLSRSRKVIEYDDKHQLLYLIWLPDLQLLDPWMSFQVVDGRMIVL